MLLSNRSYGGPYSIWNDLNDLAFCNRPKFDILTEGIFGISESKEDL